MKNAGTSVLRGEKGLSLIEVMAVIVILGILVLSFMNISGYSLLSRSQSVQRVEARHVAEDQLSKARVYLRTQQALPPNPAVPGYAVTYQLSEMSNLGQYAAPSAAARHISLQAVVLIQAVPKILTVTVSWS